MVDKDFNSYRAQHLKKQSYGHMHEDMKAWNTLKKDQMLMDRTAYVAYLEEQLQRVTTACLARNTFDERVIASRLQELEEKISALDCRLQTAHEENDGVQRRAFAALLARVESIEMKAQQPEPACTSHMDVPQASAEEQLHCTRQYLQLRDSVDSLRALAKHIGGADGKLVSATLDSVQQTLAAELRRGVCAAGPSTHGSQESPSHRLHGSNCQIANCSANAARRLYDRPQNGTDVAGPAAAEQSCRAHRMKEAGMRDADSQPCSRHSPVSGIDHDPKGVQSSYDSVSQVIQTLAKYLERRIHDTDLASARLPGGLLHTDRDRGAEGFTSSRRQRMASGMGYITPEDLSLNTATGAADEAAVRRATRRRRRLTQLYAQLQALDEEAPLLQ